MSTFIIAEAGVNHNGDLTLAKHLIDAAANSGADAVKFQSFKASSLVTKSAGLAGYQKKSVSGTSSQYEMLSSLELTESIHEDLIEYCSAKNIMYMSSPFDLDSLSFLMRARVKCLKIPSGEITNFPLLRHAAKFEGSVILSTGMSDLIEVRMAVEALVENGLSLDNLRILHCNSEYPTPMEDVNLLAMDTLKQEFAVPVGYSDHTIGSEVAIAAVARGAQIIEKHFTLDRDMLGPDHKSSMTPLAFEEMVKSIRNIEKALGTKQKIPSVSEARNILAVRKSIVASRKILEGEYLTEENLTTKRPGTGISPMKWQDIVGRTAKRSYSVDDEICDE